MKYFHNTSWMFAEQMLRMVAGLFVGIWVARYLGPEQFGIFSYALAFTSLFSGVAKLGLDSLVVRDLVNEPEKRDVYLGTAFWLKLAGAFITLAFIAFATLFTSNDHTTNVYIFIIASGTVFQSFEVVDFYFQSQVLSKFVSICKLTQLLVSSAFKLYFIFTGADLFWFVVVSLIDQSTLALSLCIAYYYQKLGGFYRYFDMSVAKQLLKNSWPLILSGLAVTVYMRIDQVMIKEMLGEREVGLYSVAVRLSEVWYFIPVIITNSLFPAIANAKKISHKLYYQRLQRLTTLMTWLAIAITLPMIYLADSIVSLLYGHNYQEAGAVLVIHIWGAVFIFLGIASGVFFTVENQTNKSLYRTLLGGISNVLLNLVLIPHYGINGAAMATVLSQCISNFLLDFFDTSLKQLILIKIKALFPVYYLWPKGDH